MSGLSHKATEMRDLSRRPARQRGQSLAEMAVVIPVLVFLLMGGFDASVMISDKITAGYAVRQGARLAAEIGGAPTAGFSPAPGGNQVGGNVRAGAEGPTAAPPPAIAIHSPSRAARSRTAGAPLESYLLL